MRLVPRPSTRRDALRGITLNRLLFQLYHLFPPGLHRWLDQWQRKGRIRSWIVIRGSRLIRTDAVEHDVTIERGLAAGLRINAAGTSPSFAAGTTEPVVQEALRDALRDGAVFYDVGANIGFFTLLAARLVGPQGTVVAFEPFPRHVAALTRNVGLNALENVEVVPKAASTGPGTGQLQLHRNAEESVRAKLESAGALKGAGDVVAVELTSVDAEVARGLAPPDVVKIDVEGAELDVLRGMAETLEAHRPTLICELHGTDAEVLPFLEGHGYATRSIEGVELGSGPTWSHVVAAPAGS